MQAISSSTVITDPYRAGIALGESLASMSPEVVFLFSSVHYSVPELLEGLHAALDRDEVIVVGNSGNGFYEITGAYDHGAAVLGADSSARLGSLGLFAGIDKGHSVQVCLVPPEDLVAEYPPYDVRAVADRAVNP